MLEKIGLWPYPEGLLVPMVLLVLTNISMFLAALLFKAKQPKSQVSFVQVYRMDYFQKATIVSTTTRYMEYVLLSGEKTD